MLCCGEREKNLSVNNSALNLPIFPRKAKALRYLSPPENKITLARDKTQVKMLWNLDSSKETRILLDTMINRRFYQCIIVSTSLIKPFSCTCTMQSLYKPINIQIEHR